MAKHIEQPLLEELISSRFWPFLTKIGRKRSKMTKNDPKSARNRHLRRAWSGGQLGWPGGSVTLGRKVTTILRDFVTLVTRIAATSKSQLRKHPLKPTLWTRELRGLCGFYSVSEAPHGSGNPPEYVATTRV